MSANKEERHKCWNILNKQTKQRGTKKDKEIWCHHYFLCVLTTNTYNQSAESRWNRLSLFAFPFFSVILPLYFFVATIFWLIMIILKGEMLEDTFKLIIILNLSVLGISPMIKSVWKTWHIYLLCVNACQFCLLIGQETAEMYLAFGTLSLNPGELAWSKPKSVELQTCS